MALPRFTRSLLLLALVHGAGALIAQPSAAHLVPSIEFKPISPRTYPRPVESALEAQIALARRGLSCGPIDGIAGAQTASALRAFQQTTGLRVTGWLDEATRASLLLDTPPLTQLALKTEDFDRLHPLDKTWLGKSQQTALAHETILEFVAELTHSSPRFIQALNPSTDWNTLAAGTHLAVPAIALPPFTSKAARLEVRLAEHVLQALDADGRLLAHFPVSIARKVEKRPIGELHVTVVIADPNYTFDPANFPDSPEAKADPARKLILAPGPNNPVGVAWIGLNLPGYGIHGTPTPEHVGRTESIGCFRLANWDARTLLNLAWVGLPVTVTP